MTCPIIDGKEVMGAPSERDEVVLLKFGISLRCLVDFTMRSEYFGRLEHGQVELQQQ